MDNFYYATIPSKLNAQARWRRGLCTRFPDDHRNTAAAQELERLAAATFAEVQPDIWTRLKPYLETQGFGEVLNEASRQVGFKTKPASISDFLAGVVRLADNTVAGVK